MSNPSTCPHAETSFIMSVMIVNVMNLNEMILKLASELPANLEFARSMGKMPPTYMKSTVSEASSKQHSFKWWQSLFLTYPWLECPRKHRHGCSAVERCLSLVHLQIHSSRIIRSQGTGSTCNLWNTPTATLRVQQYVTGAWGHVARGRITHRNLDTPFCKSVVA